MWQGTMITTNRIRQIYFMWGHKSSLITWSLEGHTEGSQLTRLLPSPVAPLMADFCSDAGADAGPAPPRERRRTGVPVPFSSAESPAASVHSRELIDFGLYLSLAAQ